MKKITENLYAITSKGLFWVPVFILTDDHENLTLIDTGLKKHAKNVIQEVKHKWGALTKIKRIIFTHRHMDHTGGLNLIMEAIKEEDPDHTVEIIMHNKEAPYFEKDIANPDLQPTRTVEHEEHIDQELRLKGIHVPGHTFGHLCLLLEKDKIMLLGDVIIWIFGGIKQVMEKAHDDWDLSQKSLEILLRYDWDIGIPSHMKLKQISRDKIEKYILERNKK